MFRQGSQAELALGHWPMHGPVVALECGAYLVLRCGVSPLGGLSPKRRLWCCPLAGAGLCCRCITQAHRNPAKADISSANTCWHAHKRHGHGPGMSTSLHARAGTRTQRRPAGNHPHEHKHTHQKSSTTGKHPRHKHRHKHPQLRPCARLECGIHSISTQNHPPVGAQHPKSRQAAAVLRRMVPFSCLVFASVQIQPGRSPTPRKG